MDKPPFSEEAAFYVTPQDDEMGERRTWIEQCSHPVNCRPTNPSRGKPTYRSKAEWNEEAISLRNEGTYPQG